ncbi:MAG: protease pro-enzyme activation domain-containing protein, partial [Candidatus Baltobacteraceae bacterium]
MAGIRRIRTLVATAVAASLLAACGGGGGASSPLPVANSGSNTPIGSTGPSSFRWGQRMLQQASYIGPLTKPVALAMLAQPQLQNEAGLVAYAQQASTPGNPNYRHFLTPQQIGQLYGASPANQAKVAAY